MLGTLHPTVNTPKTELEFVEAAIEALFDINKEVPSKQTTLLVTGKSILENGPGWKNMYGNNVGNIKYLKDYAGGNYQFLKNVFEFENGVKKYYQPPHPQTMFRWYPDLASGLKDYFLLLRNNKNYVPAWNAMLKGSCYEYILALKNGGYMTSDFPTYYNAVNSIHKRLLNTSLYEVATDQVDLEEI